MLVIVSVACKCLWLADC